MTFDETPLIENLWRVSRNFLNISLTIAAVVTCVLWAALWSMVLRPVRRLTSNIIAFGESPQDASRVIAASGRRNEIGRAETALAVMQRSLAHELAQRKRLAELGMAVARINHDLRNMSERGAAHFRPPGDNPRPARPAARAPAGRHPRSRHPVLPVDADLWRGPRTAAVAPAVRFAGTGAAGGRGRACRERRCDRLRHRHSAALLPLRRPRPCSSGAREPEPERRPGADRQGRRGRPAESHPLRRNPHRRAGADRDQRHRSRLSAPIRPSGSSSRSTPRRARPAPASASRSRPTS